MPPREKSSLKRGRAAATVDADSQKKPRRSQRISNQIDETSVDLEYLPTPVTGGQSATPDTRKEVTATPPQSPSAHLPSQPDLSHPISSPPQDTQALSQFVYPPRAFADEVEDENKEGVWGYLLPMDEKGNGPLVLRKRDACDNDCAKDGKTKGKAENKPQSSKDAQSPGGFLVGRHPECDRVLEIPTISNRHFLIFAEHKKGETVAILKDLSSNGTFVNDAMVGRNKHRELQDGDEVSILNEARFVFRYPRTRETHGFNQQYRIVKQLGKGHFATVYLCVEQSTGDKYAVKVFEKRQGDSQKSQPDDALQQEIALLKSVNHPNLLCLRDTFDDHEAAYLVLELAPEGELFEMIVNKQKLSEEEARGVFRQLFDGLKYLHERGIVHRDIKPENILVADKELHVKLGDFGLAKIIGEESFTTSLCGTPSYVAPEILLPSGSRHYTKAVDVWSLGVVLYICLCGFPPFSDELRRRDFPYSLAQQIKMGKFDYPSPYWDSVGDLVLDLIDRMLTVDPEQRLTVDECLEHPWMTGKLSKATDSTDDLSGALGKLDFSKRKMQRERTLLSSLNDPQLSQKAEGSEAPVKAGKRVHNAAKTREVSPSGHRDPKDFINIGERGDPTLYDD